jgi:hypothetical protein
MNAAEKHWVRNIRGPITVITIGVLFAVNNFTPYRFDQTWPVILIVFGILSLLGRATAPPPPPAAPPPPNYYPGGYPNPGAYRPGSYSQTPYAQPPAAPGSDPGNVTPGQGGAR